MEQEPLSSVISEDESVNGDKAAQNLNQTMELVDEQAAGPSATNQGNASTIGQRNALGNGLPGDEGNLFPYVTLRNNEDASLLLHLANAATVFEQDDLSFLADGSHQSRGITGEDYFVAAENSKGLPDDSRWRSPEKSPEKLFQFSPSQSPSPPKHWMAKGGRPQLEADEEEDSEESEMSEHSEDQASEEENGESNAEDDPQEEEVSIAEFGRCDVPLICFREDAEERRMRSIKQYQVDVLKETFRKTGVKYMASPFKAVPYFDTPPEMGPAFVNFPVWTHKLIEHLLVKKYPRFLTVKAGNHRLRAFLKLREEGIVKGDTLVLTWIYFNGNEDDYYRLASEDNLTGGTTLAPLFVDFVESLRKCHIDVLSLRPDSELGNPEEWDEVKCLPQPSHKEYGEIKEMFRRRTAKCSEDDYNNTVNGYHHLARYPPAHAEEVLRFLEWLDEPDQGKCLLFIPTKRTAICEGLVKLVLSPDAVSKITHVTVRRKSYKRSWMGVGGILDKMADATRSRTFEEFKKPGTELPDTSMEEYDGEKSEKKILFSETVGGGSSKGGKKRSLAEMKQAGDLMAGSPPDGRKRRKKRKGTKGTKGGRGRGRRSQGKTTSESEIPADEPPSTPQQQAAPATASTSKSTGGGDVIRTLLQPYFVQQRANAAMPPTHVTAVAPPPVVAPPVPPKPVVAPSGAPPVVVAPPVLSPEATMPIAAGSAETVVAPSEAGTEAAEPTMCVEGGNKDSSSVVETAGNSRTSAADANLSAANKDDLIDNDTTADTSSTTNAKSTGKPKKDGKPKLHPCILEVGRFQDFDDSTNSSFLRQQLLAFTHAVVTVRMQGLMFLAPMYCTPAGVPTVHKTPHIGLRLYRIPTEFQEEVKDARQTRRVVAADYGWLLKDEFVYPPRVANTDVPHAVKKPAGGCKTKEKKAAWQRCIVMLEGVVFLPITERSVKYYGTQIKFKKPSLVSVLLERFNPEYFMEPLWEWQLNNPTNEEPDNEELFLDDSAPLEEADSEEEEDEGAPGKGDDN